MLDIYFIYFDCNANCSTTVKYLKKYGFHFKKAFQSYSFGDQQLAEPLIHRHMHSLIYYNNTFNYGNGLSHRVDKQSIAHQFKLQKKHKSKMETRLSSLSHQFEQLQCTLDCYKNCFYPRTIAQWRISHQKL